MCYIPLQQSLAMLEDLSEHARQVNTYEPFFLKHEICQLTDHEYDMNMPTFIITW
jgi:hypothetical protein